MAWADDWLNWDFDEDDFDREAAPFKCPCKWCGKRITMTPTSDGWKPMFGGKIHICPVRQEEQRKKLVDLLPDLSLPECQFCKTHMDYERFEAEIDVGWGWPHFRLCCPKCGSMGPAVNFGDEGYDELLKKNPHDGY